MKGIVFTEFIDLIEERFGLEVADRMIESSDLESGGAYTAVGTYDHRELIALVGFLSRETGTPVPELVREFGRHLFHKLSEAHPTLLLRMEDPLTFLTKVHDTIHVEVRKLYPEAELPAFRSHFLEDGTLEFTYESPRGFADLAEGLIQGCSEHFGKRLSIERKGAGLPTHMTFHVQRAA